jgi:hypothetical protein
LKTILNNKVLNEVCVFVIKPTPPIPPISIVALPFIIEPPPTLPIVIEPTLPKYPQNKV